MLSFFGTVTLPSSGASSPVIIRKIVVLPAPLGPTSPTFSPGLSWNETSTNSTCLPYCLLTLANAIMGTLYTTGMHRPRVAVFAVCIATLQPLHPIAASQAANAFRVSKSNVADVNQEALQEINPESKKPTEVFPGTYSSPYGAMVMKRIEEMLARVDEADRNALVAGKIGAGFDRAITSWRAHPTGRTVALAVHYYRDRLLQLRVDLSDDYGRPSPLDPAEYEFSSVAVCSRAGAGAWTCGEEQLAAVAKRHNLALPNNRAGRDAVVGKLLELALADK